MALNIDALQKKPAEGGQYVSDVRICITADGVLTDEHDPLAVSLLVGAGGSIPREEAARYGLIAGEPAAAPTESPPPAGAAAAGTDPEPPAEKALAPTENKRRRGTKNK